MQEEAHGEHEENSPRRAEGGQLLFPIYVPHALVLRRVLMPRAPRPPPVPFSRDGDRSPIILLILHCLRALRRARGERFQQSRTFRVGVSRRNVEEGRGKTLKRMQETFVRT